MQMSNAEYSRLVDRMAPKSKLWKDLFNAFWTGGLICTLGQLLMNGFAAAGLDKQTAGSAVSICLVFLSAVLTGLAVYDDIAKLAGAGTLVPITGFANSIVSPAVEFKTEGVVLGTLVIIVICVVPCSYCLVRYKFPGAKLILNIYMS